MSQIRKPRRMMSDINVVPYIDVMLVLLVVFMITAPMMTQGIQVNLPKTDSGPVSDQNEPVVVTVGSEGGYYINVGEQQKQSSSLENVQGHVLRIMKNAPETLFLVEGDEAVRYGKVIELMSALQGAGVKKLGLVTEPSEPVDR